MELEVVFWFWWIAAMIFLIIEMVASGFFFLWMAAAAFMTGTLALLLPFISLDIQIFIFAILSLSSAIIWKRYLSKHPVETDQPYLNQRGSEYIGKNFILTEAIQNGSGRIIVNDCRWKVTGIDCPVSTQITVIAVDGMILQVEPTQKSLIKNT